MKTDNKGRFAKGNEGKPKGAVSEKTKFWHELKGFMTNEGAEKYKDELMKLKGKDFINSFALLLEYFEPKLSRAEIKQELKAQGLGLVINEVITKDVRNNLQDNSDSKGDVKQAD